MHKNTEKQLNKLRLGQVDFINCIPINVPIEEKSVDINAEIISEIPSILNKMILNNEIDIAPVSSLTYLENKDRLVPIGNLCIASNGPADSVLLFSKCPIEELKYAKVALSFASATSNKLAEIILNKNMNLNASFKVEKLLQAKLPEEYMAGLLIGDFALIEFSHGPQDLFVYDMGALWKAHTGLPMVFGMWVARKEVLEKNPEEVRIIAALLRQAKERGLDEMYELTIKRAMEKIPITRDFYRAYFEHLSYELTNECQDGLDFFEKNIKELDVALV